MAQTLHPLAQNPNVRDGREMMRTRTLSTPVGDVTISAEGDFITGLDWRLGDDMRDTLLDEAALQLRDYFDNRRTVFDLPLKVNGSAFQQAVCEAMSAIPFGHTRTYGEIAKALGAMPQAVGHACGGNPIPIIIPCHRVLGAKGLTGFSGAGGVETKVALLRHEGAGGFLI